MIQVKGARGVHCEREIEFLDRLAAADPAIRVHKLEVSRNRANAARMLDAARRCSPSACF